MDKRRKRAQKAKKRQEALRKGRAAPAAVDPGAVDEAVAGGYSALQAGDPAGAEKILRRALRSAPDHPTLLTNLVVTLQRQERHREALAVSRRCVAANPDFAQGHKDLSTLLKFRGDLDEASRHLRRAIELVPEHGEAWRSLTGLRRYSDPDDPDIRALRAALERVPDKSTERTALHFALAKALEDVGEYDAAFEQYATGNRRMRAGIRYRIEDLAELVEATIRMQGSEFFGRHESATEAAATPAEAPILIVGMPRSGSTLVEQILASHPHVVGVGEVPDLLATLMTAGRVPLERVRAVAELQPDALTSLGAVYTDLLGRRVSESRRIVDKHLENFLHLGLVLSALPHARVVHAVREPIDNCFACFKVLFTSNLPFTYDLGELGAYHRLLMRLMEHWHACRPGRILDVQYERLVADQEAETRRLLAFCDLPWDPACLRFHETRRRVTSASAAQIRSPIYTSSLARWRPFEAHLGALRAALAQ